MAYSTLDGDRFPFHRLAPRFAAHRHRRAVDGELEAMLARIGRALDRRLAPPREVRAVDEVTGCTVWLVEDEGAPEGLSLWIPLSTAGEQAIRDHRFRSRDIDPGHLAPPGAPFAAIYHWGYCGFTREARRSIMRLCAELLEGPLGGIDVFGRVITEEGAAAAARLGIVPCPELGEGLYVHRARVAARAEGVAG
jgi:hypothetical protein